MAGCPFRQALIPRAARLHLKRQTPEPLQLKRARCVPSRPTKRQLEKLWARRGIPNPLLNLTPGRIRIPAHPTRITFLHPLQLRRFNRGIPRWHHAVSRQTCNRRSLSSGSPRPVLPLPRPARPCLTLSAQAQDRRTIKTLGCNRRHDSASRRMRHRIPARLDNQWTSHPFQPCRRWRPR